MKHSYSSLSSFTECKRLWQRKYVLRDLPKEPSSPHLQRGIEMHKTLATAVNTGKPPVSIWTPPGFVEALHAAGAEAEAWGAIGWDGKPCSSYDPQAMLVGAMDIRLTDVTANVCTVGDWKSGHSKASPIQADAYAVLERARNPGIGVVFYPIYVDLKEVGEALMPDEHAQYRIFSMVEQAERETDFAPTRNAGCRWCPITECEFNARRK